MGYTTTFEGRLTLTPRLSAEQLEALDKLHDDAEASALVPAPSKPKPDGYCQWVAHDYGRALGWDGNEKFYHYVEWLEYVLGWLDAQGVRANGVLKWKGEDRKDVGKITVRGNEISTKEDELVPKQRTRIATARLALQKIVDMDEDEGDDLDEAKRVAQAAIEAVK